MDLRDLAREAVICLPTNTVADVTGMLEARDDDVAVVIDLDARPVGLVTTRDLARAGAGALGASVLVGNIKREVIAIGHRRSIEEARLHMQAWEQHSVPVLDEGSHVVGMLHLSDVLAAQRLQLEPR